MFTNRLVYVDTVNTYVCMDNGEEEGGGGDRAKKERTVIYAVQPELNLFLCVEPCVRGRLIGA